MQGVAAGEITPSEAAELSKLVDAHMNAIKTPTSRPCSRMMSEAPMRGFIEVRLTKVEHRLGHRIRGVRKHTDGPQKMIAYFRQAEAGEAIDLLRRERLIP